MAAGLARTASRRNPGLQFFFQSCCPDSVKASLLNSDVQLLERDPGEDLSASLEFLQTHQMLAFQCRFLGSPLIPVPLIAISEFMGCSGAKSLKCGGKRSCGIKDLHSSLDARRLLARCFRVVRNSRIWNKSSLVLGWAISTFLRCEINEYVCELRIHDYEANQATFVNSYFQ